MIASLIAAVLSGEALAGLQRAKSAAAAYLVAAVLLALGAGFLIGAGYMALADEIGAVLAALVIGGAFLLAGIVVLGIHSYAARRRAREAAARRQADAAAVAGLAAASTLPSLLKGKAGLGAIATAVVGLAAFAAYREFGRRRRDPDADD